MSCQKFLGIKFAKTPLVGSVWRLEFGFGIRVWNSGLEFGFAGGVRRPTLGGSAIAANLVLNNRNRIALQHIIVTLNMNHSFYQQVVTGDRSQIFDDQDNVVWVDWGDEEDAIVEAIRDHINASKLHANTLDADNDYGYVVAISSGKQSLVVDPSAALDSRHATLNAVDQLLTDHQIRFATPTNGGDTIAVAIERTSDWDSLYNEFGRVINETFCPICELPDLINTPGDEIAVACEHYADRIG